MLIFIGAQAVRWRETLVLLVAATIGGYCGAVAGKRLPHSGRAGDLADRRLHHPWYFSPAPTEAANEHAAPRVSAFEFASNYSYLSVMRMEREASRHEVSVQWRPFLLGPIFQSFGWSTSPFVYTTMENRVCVVRHGAPMPASMISPWQRPSTFPRATLLPARVALLGTGQPWMAEFWQVMQLDFSADRDISSPACVSEVLACLKLRRSQILAEAQAEPTKLRLRAQTELARAKGIFGAPTFFSGEGGCCWGNDHLDDALAYAAASGAHR